MSVHPIVSTKTSEQLDGIQDKITYKAIKNSKATFLSGTKKEVHQWFRLTPSFGPDLVDIMLEQMNYKKGDIVLDPFCGASTTLIQCKLNGIDAFGFEINPLLHFVGKTCINWDLEESRAKAALKKIISTFNKKLIYYKDIPLSDTDLKIPNIHNVNRWWREDVLKELLILKSSIKQIRE